MATADISKSGQHLLENLIVATGGDSFALLEDLSADEGVQGFLTATNAAFDLPSIGTLANGSADVAITGVAAGDVAFVNFRTAVSGGLVFVGATTGTDKVTLTFYNTTNGSVDNASVNVDIVVFDLT